jgi:hypothetical protein
LSLSLSEVDNVGQRLRHFVGFIRDLTDTEKLVWILKHYNQETNVLALADKEVHVCVYRGDGR